MAFLTAADVDLALDYILAKHDAPAELQESIKSDLQFRHRVINSIVASANVLLSKPEGIELVMQRLPLEERKKIIAAAELLGYKKAAEKLAELAEVKED